jgi:hypothetical protein
MVEWRLPWILFLKISSASERADASLSVQPVDAHQSNQCMQMNQQSCKQAILHGACNTIFASNAKHARKTCKQTMQEIEQD